MGHEKAIEQHRDTAKYNWKPFTEECEEIKYLDMYDYVRRYVKIITEGLKNDISL